MRKVEQQISKFFNIDDMNEVKYQAILKKAQNMRLFKNYVSQNIHDKILDYIKASNIDLNYEYAKRKDTVFNSLNTVDERSAIKEVLTTYKNAFARVIGNIQFQIQSGIIIEYYKKNTKKNVKGDLKNREIKMKSTKLGKTLEFFAKFDGENPDKFIHKKLLDDKFKNDKIRLKYTNMARHIVKFGKDRLYELAIDKKNRLLKDIKKHEFTSLSYSSMTRIKVNNKHVDIVGNNHNKKSVIDGYINIGGYGDCYHKKELRIPVRISNKYHGHLEDYVRTYTVHFVENKINRIVLTKADEIEIPNKSTNYVGIDTNIKHNLFYTSDGDEVDYNRKMMADFIKFIQKIDNRQSKKISKKRRKNYDHWQMRIHNHIIEKVVELIKKVKSRGRDHLVLEDLHLVRAFRSKSIEFGITNGRLMKVLNLSSIKHRVRRIANKHGLNVSFVNAEFTSIECNKCHHISKNNRKTQEDFICTSCGSHINADYNASINIKNRILLEVLRDSLLTKNKYGTEWDCKKFYSHQKVKQVIYDFFDNFSVQDCYP